jgi:alanine racemase
MVSVMNASAPFRRAEIAVDLGAIRANVERLRELVEHTPVMVVVKADGYGHGIVQAARAARAGGAAWLGVADRSEAMAVRRAGDTGPLLCWLGTPGQDVGELITADVDVAAYSDDELATIAASARTAGRTARVHLKVDTGLSRGGCPRDLWPGLVARAAELEAEGVISVVGIYSHFACADEPEHPANDAQQTAFDHALKVAADGGLRPEIRHLANSAAGVLRPSARYDLVRFGIAAYGLSPAPLVVSAADLGITPAMTVSARAVLTKELAPGDGVSYGHTYVADRPQHVALVPLGYGDGIPVHASSKAEVLVHGRRGRILGRVCMDQVVVETPEPVEAGEIVVLFGPGAQGEPTADEWASWCGTINYEIVTRIGGNAQRAERRWVEP